MCYLEMYTIHAGRRTQMNVLSPLVFKISLEPLVQYLELCEGASIAGCWHISTGAWFDDLNSFSNKLANIEGMLNDIELFLRGYYMELDHSKTGFYSNRQCSIRI